MRTTRLKRKIAPHSLLGFAALVVALGAIIAARLYLRVNWTDSLPRGRYLVTPVPRGGVARGELVVACPPRS
jgi:type IV secretory pathway protease TraF